MDKEQQLKKEYDKISNKLLSENSVCELSGEEFSHIEGKTLKQQVMDYFNACGNSALTQFSDVLFDEKGIKNAIHHGMSRTKAIAFAAIKPTLENGTIILPLDYYNIHDKKQKTGMIAAPITIKEEKYICVVEVIDNTITNRLYAHEVFLTKNLIEDVADSIAVLGAKTPVTHPQGEVAKILKKYIQNAYSKEEILDYLNSIQGVDHKTDKKNKTGIDNTDDNKQTEINESNTIRINNKRKIYKTNMTHIKRIDEMQSTLSSKPQTINKTEYVITTCEVMTAEDNYENGEINDSGWRDYGVTYKSDTLEGLLRLFVEKECYGYEFDLSEWVCDNEVKGATRLELSVMGSLVDEYITFDEPSAEEWKNYKNGNCNLTSFVFNLYIEKREITTNIIRDCEELGIESM